MCIDNNIIIFGEFVGIILRIKLELSNDKIK
jgi:hypothetical protein